VSQQGAIVAIENPTKMIYGFQFHPEVNNTEGGMAMIKHFLLDIAGVKPDWTMDQVSGSVGSCHVFFFF
jgi:GMP synthase (glutamine-hydrolysing)